MENFSTSDKKDILIAGLEERYESIRAIRDKVQSVGLWTLGLMIGASTWLLQHNVALSLSQKLFYMIILTIGVGVLRFKYLKDLQNGFRSQQVTSVRLEEALGFYTPRFFNKEEDTLYPKHWNDAGTNKSGGRFFQTTHTLLYTGAVILALTIITSGCLTRPTTNHYKSMQQIPYRLQTPHSNLIQIR